MSAFNNQFHVKEENGVITNVDEISNLLKKSMKTTLVMKNIVMLNL